MSKFYYIYKITLLKGSLAGHYYYGQHRTNNLNDGYAGSGVKVTEYFKKYGKIEHQTYIKEIIAFYNNDKELNEAEYNLIGDKYQNDELCLNLVPGGLGHNMTIETRIKISKSTSGSKNGFYGKTHSDEAKQKMSQKALGRISPNKGKHLSDETKQKISQKALGRTSPMKGKHLSVEAKQKISNANKGRKISKEHRQKIDFALKNSLWIYKDENELFIKKEELDEYLRLGYLCGRVKGKKRKRIKKQIEE